MGIIILLIVFLLLILNISLIRDKLSKVFLSIYICWWALLLIISTFNPYGLYTVSDKTYLLLILNITMFTFGFILSGHKQKASNINNIDAIYRIFHSFKSLLKKRIFIIILLLFTIILGYYYIRYNSVIKNYGLFDARTIRYYVGYLFGSTIEVLFYNYFIEGSSYFIIFAVAFSIVWGRINNIIFYLLILNFFFYSAVGAGRTAIIDIGLNVVFLFIIKKIISPKDPLSQNSFSRRFQHINKRRIYYIVLALIAFYGLAVYLTSFRTGLPEISVENFIIGNDVLARQIIVYCTGPFRALEYAITNFQGTFGFQYGRLTFAAFDELIGYFFRYLGVDYQVMNHLMGSFISGSIQIGNNQSFNALYTCIFNFYFDFGIIGVIILPFLYGLLFRKIIVNIEYKPTLTNLFILIVVSITTINSVFTWKYGAPALILILCGASVVSHHKLNKRKRLAESIVEI
jgi:oligosaccharide repeat unit polymerase